MATNLLLPPLTPKSTRAGGKVRVRNEGPTRKISPTYVSSDLHSPEHKQRITIPFIGLQSQDVAALGGKTWGENPTEYGGIGRLSFLGKKRAKDLFVSRGQKHFSGALSKYENQMQPYMLTAFKYSGCRQNDQVLPPCFKVGLNPYGLTVFDGSPIMPYFSHNCKHEVFPRNDPNRLDDNGRALLSERTRESLQEMYKDLYEEPFYNKTFPDHFEKTKEYDDIFSPDRNMAKYTEQNSTKNNISYPVEKTNIKYNINPTLAKLCLLSSKNQENGKRAPLRALLMNYLEHPSVFSEFRFEELYRLIKDLELFSSSDSAKHLGIDLDQYPFQRLVEILENDATNKEKLLLMREALGFLPPPACGTIDASGTENGEVSGCKTDEIAAKETAAVMNNDKGIYQFRKSTELLTATLPSHSADNEATKEQMPTCPPKISSKCKQTQMPCSRETMQGTSPCWPPSKSYGVDLRTMQLKCPSYLPRGQNQVNCDSIKGGKKLKPDPEDQIVNRSNVPVHRFECNYNNAEGNMMMNSEGQSVQDWTKSYPDAKRKEEEGNAAVADIEMKGLNEYKEYLHSFLPAPFDLRGRLDETTPCRLAATPPSSNNKLNKLEYVGYDKLGRKTYLPPVSLTDCLQHTGERIQDRIGLHFKMEANRRFHAMYPDSVPDLCDNISYRKRYFFSGYHTSVFRG